MRRAHARAFGARSARPRRCPCSPRRSAAAAASAACVSPVWTSTLERSRPDTSSGIMPLLIDVDGDAARDLAGVVAAHAVGEHGEAASPSTKIASSLCARTMPGWDRLATSSALAAGFGTLALLKRDHHSDQFSDSVGHARLEHGERPPSPGRGMTNLQRAVWSRDRIARNIKTLRVGAGATAATWPRRPRGRRRRSAPPNDSHAAWACDPVDDRRSSTIISPAT